MIKRIDPVLPIITPKGKALAHFVIDYGIENDLCWVCVQDDTGEFWTWSNRDIRAQKNITSGRENITPFYDPHDVAFPSDDILCQNHVENNKKEWWETEEGKKALLDEINRRFKFDKDGEMTEREPNADN